MHNAWPLAQVHRLARLSHFNNSFIVARREFVWRCASSLVNPSLCEEVATSPHFAHRGNRESRSGPLKPFHVVIPYHPAYGATDVARQLRSLSARWKMELALEFNCSEVCISWQSAAHSVLSYLRKHQRV